MSLGVLSGRSRPMQGLGAVAPQPWCWKAAGYPWGAAFDACHAKCYNFCTAQKRWPGTVDGDKCVFDCDWESCECPKTAPTGAGTTKPSAGGAAPAGPALVMGNKTSDPRVTELQKAINAVLTKNGYAAVGTDGKLGPGTCGAAREADKFGAGLMAKYGLASVCTSFTNPVKLGSGGGGFAPPSDVTNVTPTTQAGILGMDMQTLLLVGAIAAGAWVFFGDKKKKATS